jgi:16S rRNA (guanine527-N7)-methyltransferase
MTDDPAEASPVIARDSELEKRLAIYVELLGKWKNATNLISESGFANVWKRHIADCMQLLAFAPDARRWVDLGSGAGFPGMVIAIQLAECPGAIIHCVESDKRKAAFLRQVARATGAPALVHVNRIELVDPKSLMPVDAVTARGLAALPQLIEFANVWLMSGAIGIFPCGRSAQGQAQKLGQAIKVNIEIYPNKLDPSARIVRVWSPPQANL